MNLQIDVGNTFLKWRVTEGVEIIGRGGHVTNADEYLAAFPYWGEIKTIALASVASEESEACLLSVLRQYRPDLTPYVACTEPFFGHVRCAYDLYGTMGVDRWLALIAGYLRYGESCCVVDCGSAITVDTVGSSGLHEGGYILPGIRLMKKSLMTGTEKVEFEDASVVKMDYGKNTTECVQNGINYMIFSVFDSLKRRLYQEGITHLFVTGGDAGIVASLHENVEVVPDLVLDGLALVSHNSKNRDNT